MSTWSHMELREGGPDGRSLCCRDDGEGRITITVRRPKVGPGDDSGPAMDVTYAETRELAGWLLRRADHAGAASAEGVA